MRPPGRTTRASSAKNAPSSTRFRRAKPQVTPSTRRVGQREAKGVGLGERAAGPGVGQHAEGEVEADRLEALGGELAAEVAGAAGQVGHHRARAEAQVADGAACASPTSIRNVMIRLTRS